MTITINVSPATVEKLQAEHLGLLSEINAQLNEWYQQRDALQGRLNACHEVGNAWIEKDIRSFDFIELLREAIFFVSARPREMVLKGLALNYSVDCKKPVWEPRAPFRQVEQKGDRLGWCTALYDVRTEIIETFDLLQSARLAIGATVGKNKGPHVKPPLPSAQSLTRAERSVW